ncbi:hypothetical protein [Duganella sp. S19_KUP01_CR8]|uniref:hypothetical protein n=1 Tax=Duganella sp. S19_KUP01_CR8 TaxID=3025502 RepID=UPI002FCD946D
MHKKFSFMTTAFRILAAGAIGGVAYLIVCSALRSTGGPTLGRLDDYENYFAIGTAVVITVVVFWRLTKGAWSKEQLGDLLNIDDSAY